jgi:hypothetical protein
VPQKKPACQVYLVRQINPVWQIHPARQVAAQERQKDQAGRLLPAGQGLPGTNRRQVRQDIAGPMPGLLPKKAGLARHTPVLNR